MSHPIPYITLEDLDRVLTAASHEDLISPETSQEIFSRSESQVQFVIRKAQEQKDINELRQRCLAISASISRSGARGLEAKRSMIAKAFVTDKELLWARHMANNAQIKEDFLAQRENCFRNIDMLQKLIENEGEESEEGKIAAKKISSNKELIRTLKSTREELKVYELERYHKELSELKKKYIEDMEEVNRKLHNLHVDKTHAVQMIQQTDPAKLTAIFSDLNKMQPTYQKGGAQ